MKTLLALITGTLLAVGCASAAQPSNIEQIVPTLTQLGAGWTSTISCPDGFTTNSIVVLVDQLNPTNEICNPGGGKSALQIAHQAVGKRDCNAYMLLRYLYAGNTALIHIKRFTSPESIGADWGRDKQSTTTPESVLKVGEETRFFKRHGTMPNLAFRRGIYLVEIQALNLAVDKLQQLANVLDANILKEQQASEVKHAKTAPDK